MNFAEKCATLFIDAIQTYLGGGQWNADNCIPTNIVFGGEVLVETDDEIITLKNHQDVRDIVEYLHQNKLQEIIQKNFWNIDDENFMYKKRKKRIHIILA